MDTGSPTSAPTSAPASAHGSRGLRKVIAAPFYSVNGVAQDPFKFQYDSFDSGLGEFMTRNLAQVDTVVMGHQLYSEWSDYWPRPDTSDAFKQFINPVKKYVLSSSLHEPLSWENSELFDGDAADLINSLKQQDGKTIAVVGGLKTWRSLFTAGLIDELTLVIFPALASNGRHLFEDAPDLRLSLVECTNTEKGNVLLTYSVLN